MTSTGALRRTSRAVTDGSASSLGTRGSRRRRRWAALVAALVTAVAAAVLVGSTRSPQPTPAARLTWAPPALLAPVTVTVTDANRSLKLDDAHDYRVVLPPGQGRLSGGVTITGGHDVVVVGGTITVPDRAVQPDAKQRRGLYLKDQTGTVHVEGVRLAGDLSDGINLDQRRGAVVQLQNIQVDLAHGSRDGHHADVLQTWAGPRRLLVDGLRGASQYQGLFLLPTQQWPEGDEPQVVDVRRSVITMASGSAYALWLPRADPSWWHGTGLTVRRALDDTGPLVWPRGSTSPRLVGPDEPTELPGGVPGDGYVSPGYLDAPGSAS